MEEFIVKLTAALGDEAKAKEISEKAGADGVTDLAGAALLTEADLIGYGVPKIKARQLVIDLKPAPVAVPAAETAAPQAAYASVAMLPQVPGDEAFLKMLQVGGVLKMAPTDVMSAVRVLFAERYGLEEIDERLLAAIEQRAESMDEPYPDVYYSIQKVLARKAHAEVLSALEVSSARVFTAANKKKFLARFQDIWHVLASFNERATAYQQTWMNKMANPGMMIAALRGAQIPGMDAAPDASPMLDAATGVIDAINKMFAGAGIPVARGLAADAIQRRQLLERPDLMAAVGAVSRDELLKKLGIAVTADAARTEQTVTQYVLAVMSLPDVPTTQLAQYISAIAELGMNVPWDTLCSGATANGARRTGSRQHAGSPFSPRARDDERNPTY